MTSELPGGSVSPRPLLETVFECLAPEDLAHLQRVASVHQYPAGVVLCHEGQHEGTLYVLASGSVKITQRMPSGEDHLLATFGPGQFFGEMALIDDSPRSASATTTTDVTAFEITEPILREMLRNSPALAGMLLHRAQEVLRTSMRHQIQELTEKNRDLEKAYRDLQDAQAQLLEDARIKRDLEVAAQIQRSMLPTTFPQVGGLSFAAYSHPAREVGGDLYDAFRLDDQHVGFLIADVSDKSIHAAIFMAIARGLFRTESRRCPSPSEVAASVNGLLLDLCPGADMFVTALYGIVHLDDGRLVYVRAGHDRPLLCAADGSIRLLDARGRFLGMVGDYQAEERTVDLRPGDRLVMYSDGIPDAKNEAGERYSLERLREKVAAEHKASAQDLLNAIVADVEAFCGDAPVFDDFTLLVMAVS